MVDIDDVDYAFPKLELFVHTMQLMQGGNVIGMKLLITTQVVPV